MEDPPCIKVRYSEPTGAESREGSFFVQVSQNFVLIYSLRLVFFYISIQFFC